MPKRKKINMTSLAISEEKDLNRLSDQAKKGWLLQDIKIPYLSYELIESEGIDQDYLVDFNEDVTEQYLSTYKKKGWNYVCSNGALHYFYAHINNVPFYTNIENKIKLYQEKANHFFLTFLVFALTSAATAFVFSYFRNQPTPNRTIISVLFASTLLQLVITAYFIYAAYSYFSKANNLKKEFHETTNSKNK